MQDKEDQAKGTADVPLDLKDPMTRLFAGLAAAFNEIDADAKWRREERLNRPEAVAARKRAAEKGWKTRRDREAEEEARDLERYQPLLTKTCDSMAIVMDAQEVFCIREPHTEGDHEDAYGHTWERGPWDDE
ncbi:hypothetical protein ACFVH9_08595 [Streptomyces hirsutus]|uniref:hypothetical protein n=1 Tax=Streptomyces hirsutus TaxID=35620 RepID=UPI003633E911